MKRTERRELQEKLNELIMEDIQLPPERMDKLLANAKAALDAQEPTPAKKTGKRIGRRIGLVFAAAASILVCSFVYTAIMPESVSSANNFFRTAAIWVNNTLHLGFEFETPPRMVSQYPLEDMTFTSVADAAPYSPLPLVELTDPSLTFGSIEFFSDSSTFSEIAIMYRLEPYYINISVIPFRSDNQVTFDNISFDVVRSQVGDILCWHTEPYCRAYVAFSDVFLEIISTIPYETFLEICSTLQPIS